jgi:hypothetical protein
MPLLYHRTACFISLLHDTGLNSNRDWSNRKLSDEISRVRPIISDSGLLPYAESLQGLG